MLAYRDEKDHKDHGLLIDMGVTTDAVRILRTPGSYHWKTGEGVKVNLDPRFFQCGPYDLPYLMCCQRCRASLA